MAGDYRIEIINKIKKHTNELVTHRSSLVASARDILLGRCSFLYLHSESATGVRRLCRWHAWPTSQRLLACLPGPLPQIRSWLLRRSPRGSLSHAHTPSVGFVPGVLCGFSHVVWTAVRPEVIPHHLLTQVDFWIVRVGLGTTLHTRNYGGSVFFIRADTLN